MAQHEEDGPQKSVNAKTDSRTELTRITSKLKSAHRTLVALLVILITTLIIIFLLVLRPKVTTTIEGETYPSDAVTFVAKVPGNTPQDDLILLEYHGSDGINQAELTATGEPHTYSVSLPFSELERVSEKNNGKLFFKYRYNRNGWDFRTTEYLENADNSNAYWKKLGRRVQISAGNIQRDTVDRWRWLPPDGEAIESSNLGPNRFWQERINNQEFWSGQIIQDLYLEQYEPHYDNTAQHLKDLGYEWAGFTPPWQWIKSDPLPKVGNSLELGISEDDPNYPSDTKFLEHLVAFKSAGLKLYVAPQICCELINTENRSAAWWNEYANEVERFLVHHAKLSQTAGVDAFLFDTFGYANQVNGPQPATRINRMLAKIRKVYDGRIGTSVATFLPDDSPTSQGIIPEADSITWGKKIDFFILQAGGQLSGSATPSRLELKKGAGAIIDDAKALYKRYKKPVVVYTQYFSIKQAWRGPDWYHRGHIPAEEDPEDSWKMHKFSAKDQARTINAFLDAIAERPWVIGYMNFGYWHWDMPLLGDWSTRGKAADDVINRWNQHIYQ